MPIHKKYYILFPHGDQDVRLIVFPELSLCGYTCQDLLYENILMDSMEEAIFKICQENTSDAIIVIGCALRQYNHLYNCAVFIHQHSILGIVPKTYLPNYNEFYEKRWFQVQIPVLMMISIYMDSAFLFPPGF